MKRSFLLIAIAVAAMLTAPACSSQNDDSNPTDASTDTLETDAKTDIVSASDSTAEHDTALLPDSTKDSTTDGFTDVSEDIVTDTANDVVIDTQTDMHTDTQTDTQTDADAAPPSFVRFMTYNIHHGTDSSLKSIAKVITTHTPDIVGLQEVDYMAERSGKVDQTKQLSELTKLPHYTFQKALDLGGGGQYGVALVSRFPIVKATNKRLTSVEEQRILAKIDIETTSGTFTVGVTHFGLKSDERVKQATEVIGEISSAPTSIVMGDLNAKPDSNELKTLTSVFHDAWELIGNGPGYTFSSTKPNSRIDYILLGKAWPTPTHAEVVSTPASDHLPLIVDVPLFPKP